MYRVTCPSCNKAYDATQAPDCSCLQPVRSVRCPHCGSCSCDAPAPYRKSFWNHAPAELWDRRRAREASMGKGAQPAAEAVDPTKPVVLFADDDPTSREIARRLIGTMGVTVVLASNGEEALQLIRAHRPALVITDALMPKLDGREVALLAKQEDPRARVVVITSVYKDPRYKHEAYSKFAVDDYLAKPVKPAELRAIVEKYLPAVVR